MIGFSAGGHLVAATSVHFEERVYARVDVTGVPELVEKWMATIGVWHQE